MKLVKANESQYYDASKHFNCWTGHKLTAGQDSQKITISYSHFLPNGGAEMSASPAERVYYVTEGSIVLKGKNNDVYQLNPGDMICIAPGEERSVEVVGNEPATMLVIIVK